MIEYSLDYNPIREYWNDIISGREIVSDKVRRTFEWLIYKLDHEDQFEFFYDPKRGNHIIEFAENYCRHSKGKFAGKPVILETWEKAILAAAFGFIDIEGNRQYQEVILIVAKKNGKSLISSVVGLYLMVADNEGGPEVYSVATMRDQAKIVWGEAKRMVNKSPVLKQIIKPLIAEMTSDDWNDGVFKPLASNVDSLDGKNVHGVLMDEFHQWKNGRALFDIMVDGMVNREQPMNFMTSTAGTVREDIYDEKYDEVTHIINGFFDPDGYKDPRVLPFIYELDKREEWTDPKCWKKANPGLGTIKKFEALARKVEKAIANPRLVKNLLTKEFNIRETSTEAWLSFEQANNEAVYDLDLLKPKYAIGGTDLSKTTDLTSAKVIFMMRDDPNIYVLSMYWIPEDLVEQRVKEDKIRYDLWIERGLVRTCPGNKVHPKYVTEWFLELRNQYKIYLPWIGYDAWSADYWVEEMEGYFGKEAMVKVIQGKKTLSGPMHSLGADLAAKRIIYNNNPVDKWCLVNTTADIDKNGNISPIKSTNQRRRIDGTVSLLNAYTVLMNKRQDYLNMI